MGASILWTVRNAARLAVYEEMMMSVNAHLPNGRRTDGFNLHVSCSCRLRINMCPPISQEGDRWRAPQETSGVLRKNPNMNLGCSRDRCLCCSGNKKRSDEEREFEV